MVENEASDQEEPEPPVKKTDSRAPRDKAVVVDSVEVGPSDREEPQTLTKKTKARAFRAKKAEVVDLVSDEAFKPEELGLLVTRARSKRL